METNDTTYGNTTSKIAGIDGRLSSTRDNYNVGAGLVAIAYAINAAGKMIAKAVSTRPFA